MALGFQKKQAYCIKGLVSWSLRWALCLLAQVRQQGRAGFSCLPDMQMPLILRVQAASARVASREREFF